MLVRLKCPSVAFTRPHSSARMQKSAATPVHTEKRQRSTHRRTDLSPTASDHLEKSTVVPSRSHTLKFFAYTRRRVVVCYCSPLGLAPTHAPVLVETRIATSNYKNVVTKRCGNERIVTKRCQDPRHLPATCLRVGSGFKSPIIGRSTHHPNQTHCSGFKSPLIGRSTHHPNQTHCSGFKSPIISMLCSVEAVVVAAVLATQDISHDQLLKCLLPICTTSTCTAAR